MEQNIEQGAQVHRPYAKEGCFLSGEFDVLVKKQTCRFRNPNFLERIRETVIRLSPHPTIVPANGSVVFGIKLSPTWLSILRYLCKEGLIDDPSVKADFFSNTAPKFMAVRLGGGFSTHKNEGGVILGYGATIASFETALSKAVGELLERFVGSKFNRNNFSRLSDLGKIKKLPIQYLPSFFEFQRKRTSNVYVRHKEGVIESLFWVTGEELLSNRKAAIPAQCVFWRYKQGVEGEAILRDSTTSGLGGGFTLEEATLSALYENIERDAFLIYWLNHAAPRRVSFAKDWALLSSTFLGFLEYLDRYKLKVTFLDITSDFGIPTVLAVITYKEPGVEPVVVIGGAAGFDGEKMMERALVEALSIYNGYEFRETYVLNDGYIPFIDSNIGKDERTALWRGEVMWKRFQFFLSGDVIELGDFLKGGFITPRVFKDKVEELNFVLNLFKLKNKVSPGAYEVYRYICKDKLLSDLGYYVVRIVVPALVPLYLTEHKATLDAERLREVPKLLGFPALNSEDYTPWPHPFP